MWSCLLLGIMLPPLVFAQSSQRVQTKLESIILPSLTLKDAGLSEAVTRIRELSTELDTNETDPVWKGVRIGFEKIRSTDPVQLITLSLKEVSLETALDKVCNVSGRRLEIFNDGVVLRRAPMDDGEMKIRQYYIPNYSEESAPRADPFAPLSSKPKEKPVKELLESTGILFPKGASAIYISRLNRLIVRNTAPNLEMVDAYVETLFEKPQKQITVVCEVYSLDSEKVMELLDAFDGDSKSLVAKMREKVEKGELKPEAMPSVVTRSGQRAKVENGSTQEFVIYYSESGGKDEPVTGEIYHGTTLEVDPVCGKDETVELNLAVTHSTRQPVIRKSTVLAPVSSKEVSIETIQVPNAKFSTAINVKSGTPTFAGSVNSVEGDGGLFLFFVTATIEQEEEIPFIPE
jgi:gamma-glutamylcyclotransferase (GGCT)/AIG2-like uncharacterized protein YtfP